MKRFKHMVRRPTAYLILSMVLSLCGAFGALAQQTHLDIAVPSRVESDLFGPVKHMKIKTKEMSTLKRSEERFYDKAGNLLTKTKWDKDNKVTYTVTNTFNEAGCLVHQRVKDIEDEKLEDLEVIINVKARKIAYRDLNTGEVEICAYSTQKFHMTSNKRTRDKKPISSFRYFRGSDNKETRWISSDEKGHAVTEARINWHPKGYPRTTRYIYHNKDNEILITYEYLTFDDYGNWTQRIEKSVADWNGKELKYDQIVTREIEYFEL